MYISAPLGVGGYSCEASPTSNMLSAQFCLISVIIASAASSPQILQNYVNVTTTTESPAKFFNFFNFVKFNNDPCATSDNRNGTCYSRLECAALGGNPLGLCAKGFGVCCLIEKSCGDTTNVNNTYFVSKQGRAGIGQCPLTIQKTQRDICQMRLDFDEFILAPPEATNNVCQDDLFIVSAGSPVNIICGSNRGQHIYVDAGLGDSPAVLNVVSSAPFNSRTWKIRISQISCYSKYRAPEGCLQFFASATGTISSFNFDGTVGSKQLSDQNYAICVRAGSGYCGVKYTQCDSFSGVNTFSLSGMQMVAAQGAAMAGTDMAFPTENDMTTATNCQKDFLVIPCASETKGVQALCKVQRFCGGTLTLSTTMMMTPGPVYSWLKPFILRFKTDSLEQGGAPMDTMNRGFCLTYVQQPCT